MFENVATHYLVIGLIVFYMAIVVIYFLIKNFMEFKKEPEQGVTSDAVPPKLFFSEKDLKEFDTPTYKRLGITLSFE